MGMALWSKLMKIKRAIEDMMLAAKTISRLGNLVWSGEREPTRIKKLHGKISMTR